MLIEIRGGPYNIAEANVNDEIAILHIFWNADGSIAFYYVFIGYNEHGLPVYQFSAKE